MCGEVRPEHIGQRLVLSGWAHRRRDHGGLVFVDLRDERGLCQLVVNPERAPEAIRVAHEVRNEFVLRAEGEVVARALEAVNPNLPTGEVELQVDALEIVSRCPPLPFQLDEEGVDETLRLRYRWLDLRRDSLQRNIRLRAKAVSIIRREMEAEGFADIETPIMADASPEGPFLRAAPVAADLQAAARDLGLRALLPDRTLLPGRGSACRPTPGADPARRRDGLPRSRVPLRPHRADVHPHLGRVHRRSARAPVPAYDLGRGAGAL